VQDEEPDDEKESRQSAADRDHDRLALRCRRRGGGTRLQCGRIRLLVARRERGIGHDNGPFGFDGTEDRAHELGPRRDRARTV
jgi:hypothetical protein